jgi:glycosyltransferase involved in cell wall biosynthesis
MRTAEYIKNRKFKKILMAEDCRVLYQKRSYEQSRNLKQKVIRFWEYKKLMVYEPQIVNSFDIVTLVTDNDIEAMQKNNPTANYRLLTNGTDIHHFQKPKEDKTRNGILFIGKLDVWANVLMVENIVNNILPIIKKEIPEVQLYIIGSNPPKRIQRLETKDIHIIPNVPDVVPYLQSMALFLHPHFGGSGIQNKLIEAMACGCPVVTTPTGIQGIPAQENIHVLIGTSPIELAKNTVRLLKDKEFAKYIGCNARELILNTHSWEAVYDATDKIINELIN